MRSLEDKHIESYLLNRLSEEDRSEFEARILEDAELFKEVQNQGAFIDALRTENRSLLPNSRTQFVQWLLQPYSLATSMALTASVAILLGSTLNFIDQEQEAAGMSLVASSLTLETLRGQDNLFVSNGTAPILLTIDVGPDSTNNSSEYIVSLRNRDTNQEYLINSSPQISDQGWLRIVIAQDLVGEYELSVRNSDQTINSFEIQFTE